MGLDGTHDVLGRLLSADVDEGVIGAMSTREQRYTLYHLLDHERVTLDELADVLAGWMAAAERRVVTSVDRESLRIGLYHHHLPKLDGVGLVEFDPAERVVERAPGFRDERDLIEAAYLTEDLAGGETG